MIVTAGLISCCCPIPLLPHAFGTGNRTEAVFVEVRSQQNPAPPDRLQGATDRVVVVGNTPRTLDLLRLATIRSDEVVLITEPRGTEPLAQSIQLFIERFAIEVRPGPACAAAFYGAAAVLLAIGDVARENVLVRSARRQHIPVHVEGRPLVSDFTVLELVERHPASIAVPPETLASGSGPTKL